MKFSTLELKFITYKFEDMRTTNPNSNAIYSFKYSILISLHSNDIPNNPERISNLNPCTHRYNSIHLTPKQLERNTPNVSVTIFNENQEQIYISNNNSSCQGKYCTNK